MPIPVIAKIPSVTNGEIFQDKGSSYKMCIKKEIRCIKFYKYQLIDYQGNTALLDKMGASTLFTSNVDFQGFLFPSKYIFAFD